MNIFSLFAQHIHSCVFALEKEGFLKNTPDVSRITVEPPRDASHGDIATNAAMVLAKDAGCKPRDLAEKIAEKLAVKACMLHELWIMQNITGLLSEA